ncbi:M48 family metallopeptidase [Kitasatospora sp. NPDC096147]|uniref:M48 family metallopeptidase n=1 Tax=Kitasatospora sp. NPDC096147 TaxID=3364093 RepID=UPI00381BB5D2
MGSAGARPSGRAVTSVLFALLSLEVALSTLIVARGAFAISPGGRNWIGLWNRCLTAHPLGGVPTGITDLPSFADWSSSSSAQLAAVEACAAPAQHDQLRWLVGGLVLVLVVAALLYAAHPPVLARRYRLRGFDPSDAALLLAELERLRRTAGAGRVRFLSRPFDPVPSAFVAGLPGRRTVVLSAGLVVRHHTDPAAFRATVLHELAHLRNRDVDQTYAALTLTGAFALVVGGAGLWFATAGGAPPGLVAGFVLRVIGLLMVSVVLLAALVRSREFQADARVGPGTAEGDALTRILSGMPTPPRRARPRLHPAPGARLAALYGSVPLFGQNFSGGLGIGLVAMVGLTGLSRAAWLLVSDPARAAWTAAAIAVPVAAAVVGGQWRPGPQALAGSERAGSKRVWPFALGLSVGLALGPLLSLETAFGRIDALGLLVWNATWVPLVVVLATPVTCWVVRSAATAARAVGAAPAGSARTARATLLTVVLVLATAAYTIVLRLVDQAFLTLAPLSGQGPGAALSTLAQPFALPGLAHASAAVPAVLGCAVVSAAVVAGIAIRRRLRDRPPWTGASMAAIRAGSRAGLIGGAALAVLILLSAWQAHQLPLLERWSHQFVIRFQLWLILAADVIALLTGLVAAGREPRTGLLRGGTAALVCATVGAFAMVVQPLLGHCADAFALRPSSRGCLTAPTGDGVVLMVNLLPGVTGVLCVLLLPPWLGLRSRLAGRLPQRLRVRRWAVGSRGFALAAILPLLAGLYLAGHLVTRQSRAAPALAGASVGDHGWVGSTGYRFRLAPGWFDVSSQPDDTGAQLRIRPEDFVLRAQVTITRITEFPIDSARTTLLAQGGHETLVGGHRALVLEGQPPGEDPSRFVLVEDGGEQLLIRLSAQPQTWSDRVRELDTMLAGWQWTG